VVQTATAFNFDTEAVIGGVAPTTLESITAGLAKRMEEEERDLRTIGEDKIVRGGLPRDWCAVDHGSDDVCPYTTPLSFPSS
jgi:hypothetical protein